MIVTLVVMAATKGPFSTPSVSLYGYLQTAQAKVPGKSVLTYNDMPFLWLMGIPTATLNKLEAVLAERDIQTADELASLTEGRTLFKILLFFHLHVNDSSKIDRALEVEKPAWWDLFRITFPWG